MLLSAPRSLVLSRTLTEGCLSDTGDIVTFILKAQKILGRESLGKAARLEERGGKNGYNQGVASSSSRGPVGGAVLERAGPTVRGANQEREPGFSDVLGC